MDLEYALEELACARVVTERVERESVVLPRILQVGVVVG